MKFFVSLAVLAFVMFGLLGCGSHKESQRQAEQNLCASLDNFTATLLSLQGVSLQSTSEDDVKSAADNVNKAWDRVVADARDVNKANIDAIQSAYVDLKGALRNRPTSKPIAEVIAGLEPKIAAFAGAGRELANGLDCSAR
jgi:gamma-glutamyl:cysteine ligase YbdK (ATP-grasp superfamily)